MPDIPKALKALFMAPANREAFQRSCRKPIMSFVDDLEPGFIRVVNPPSPPAEAGQQIDRLAKAEIYPLSIETTPRGTQVVFAVPRHVGLG